MSKLWKDFSDKLSRKALDALTRKTVTSCLSIPETDFFEFCAGLSSPTRTALFLLSQKDTEQEEPTASQRYHLIVYPDGEWPFVTAHNKPESLAKSFAKYLETDVIVKVFYGSLLQFTKGPDRWILLPDDTAILASKKPKRIPVSDLPTLEIQDDDHLGGLEFSTIPKLKVEKLGTSKSKDEESSEEGPPEEFV